MTSFKTYFKQDGTVDSPKQIENYLRNNWKFNFDAGNIRIDLLKKEVFGSNFSLTVTEENLVDVDGKKVIPVKFSTVADFQHINKNTESFTLEYAPHTTKDFWSVIDPYFNDVNYLPQYSSNIDISQCLEFKSLHNIHKRVKRTHVVTLCNMIESSILGLMLIPELGQIEFINFISSGTSNDTIFTLTNTFRKALESSADVLDVKAELIEKGLSQFAKL
jgi:hypothetical protein